MGSQSEKFHPETEKKDESLKDVEDLVKEENISVFKSIEANSIGKEIINSIQEKLINLTEGEKNKIAKFFNNFLKSTNDYHDGYLNLKGTARKYFYFNDFETKKFQKSIERADERERVLHNTFIDSLNILSRNMKNIGLENSWRRNFEIYSSDPKIMRDKTRNWMFKIFDESL